MAGNIKGITIEFNGDTTKLDKALREVRSSTKDIDKELKDVDKALKFNPTSVDLWRQKQNLLKDKIAQTQSNLSKLKDAQKQMDAKGVDKNSKEYRELQREIITTESKLKTFKAQLRALGNVKLQALGQQFKQIGAKMMGAGRTLSMYVTAPLVGAGTIAVKKFAEVDKTMTLTNSTMGNTAEEAKLLNDAMKEAAANSTYGMKDAATASLNFARAGLDATQAANTLAPAMALAAGEGGNLDTVSGGLVATINGFGDSFENAGTYADVFANACNNSALDVDSLSHAMSVAAPIFSAAGYEVNDAALYMGIMANNGIEADKAANSLKTGMARLIKPTEEASDWMTELGIEVTNADGSMKSSTEVQQSLHDAFGALSESEQIAAASAIFGKNQMAPWLALINTAPGKVDELSEALGTEGTAMQMQEDMMSGFAGSLEKIKSGIDVAATSLGEALAPMLQIVANGIQKLVDGFNGLSPATQTTIAVIGVIAAAIGPLLLVIGALVSAVGTLMTSWGAISGALAVITGPIGIAVAAIAAIVAAMVLAYNKSAQFRLAVDQLLNVIKSAFIPVFAAAKKMVGELWKTFVDTAATVGTVMAPAIKALLPVIKMVATFMAGRLKAAFTIITVAAKLISAAIKGIAIVFSGVVTKVAGLVNSLKNKFESVAKAFKRMFSGGIKAPHVPLPHFAIKPPGWKIGDLVKGKIPSLSVDWYAKGGIFTRPTVLTGVGEAGPEAVVPLDKLWDAIAENTGGVVINVNGAGDPYAVAQEVKRVLIEETKRRRLAWQ